jgi:hypothetical protein
MTVLSDPLGWFTLQLPDGWESETEDCVTTLRGPLGLGVLYISGGRHAGGRQASFGGADFLARFLRSLGIDVDDDAIEGSAGVGCRIYSYRRDDEGAHWRYWSVTDDETALLLSYTCGLEDLGAEAPEVERIVQSIRLFHSAPVH